MGAMQVAWSYVVAFVNAINNNSSTGHSNNTLDPAEAVAAPERRASEGSAMVRTSTQCFPPD